MGSSGSSAGSLCRSNQSSRTGLGGRGCCAAAVRGTAAAALPSKAMNSRLFIVASLLLRRLALRWCRGVGQRKWLLRPRVSECSPHLALKATPLVDVSERERMTNKRRFVCAFAATSVCVDCRPHYIKLARNRYIVLL